ncbi:MAG: hypothetical protein U9N45_07855 [Gemmatimonadota bacterium]|nr:hypothetical protein [Gemmatimonadota bacterium]
MNLKLAGYILFVVSTVAASVFASRIPVMTGSFAVSLLAMVLSLRLIRRGAGKAVTDTDSAGSGEDNYFDFAGCLASIASALDALLEREEHLSCEDIHTGLDSLIEGRVFEFAQAREELLNTCGFGPYARVMSDFTRAERAMNRAWSAAVDGYPAEAIESLKVSREIFCEVAKELNKSL